MDKAIFSKKVLDVEQLCAAALLSEDLFSHDTEVSLVYDQILRGMAVNMRRKILGEDLSVLEFPVDWWHSFKARWFPARLLRRWPVRYRVIHIKRLYPDAVIPTLGRSFSVAWEKDLGRSG